jgi:hypothetical protein
MKHVTKVAVVTVLAWLTFFAVFVPIVSVWVVVPRIPIPNCSYCYSIFEVYESVTYHFFGVGAVSHHDLYKFAGGPFTSTQWPLPGAEPYPGPVGVGFPWLPQLRHILSDPLANLDFFVMLGLFILGAALVGQLLPYTFPELGVRHRRQGSPLRIITMESPVSRNKAFAFIGIALAVVGMSGGYVVMTATQYRAPGGCSTPVGSPPSGTVHVFQLSPGTEGAICLNFQLHTTGFYFFSQGSYCTERSVANGCPDLEVAPSVNSFYHVAGQNVTVVLTVRAGTNSTEHYVLDFGQCGQPWILVVVGPLPTSIWLGYPLCIPPLTDVSVTGVSGFNVADLPLVPSGNGY